MKPQIDAAPPPTISEWADNQAVAKLWNDAMADVIAENRKLAAKNRGLSPEPPKKK
ncbi:MAG TPA: hypothetical protein VH640_03275 [Bryobacteraceae bacterium]|jgi:hypothetical protein